MRWWRQYKGLLLHKPFFPKIRRVIKLAPVKVILLVTVLVLRRGSLFTRAEAWSHPWSSSVFPSPPHSRHFIKPLCLALKLAACAASPGKRFLGSGSCVTGFSPTTRWVGGVKWSTRKLTMCPRQHMLVCYHFAVCLVHVWKKNRAWLMPRGVHSPDQRLAFPHSAHHRPL